VKFIWFHLMSWPYLPDDFRQRYRSVWVDIPPTLYDPVRGNELYHRYLGQLEYAEECGWDGIGVNEHHSNAYGLMPSPNLMAAALSRRTSRAALVVLGNSIALYNPPVRVAEELAMLDVLSGGRVVAGFPVGTSMDTNYCYGQVPSLTRDKYAEAHDLIVRAWTEDQVFSFDGKYNQQRYVNCWPKPIQKPHPPVWIPGGGSVETWDFCAEHDYNYSFLSFFGYEGAKVVMDGFWERVAAAGKDDSPYRATFAQQVCVADTDAEAEKLYKPHVDYFYNRCLHVYPGFADAPGYRTVRTMKESALGAIAAAAVMRFESLTWKELLERGYIIAGSPATVRERLAHVARGLRVGNLICGGALGTMPDDLARHSTRLMADEVIPHLRDLWPEWKHDERFWPKPLEGRVDPTGG
jgi:alkanesulfonate monooxygenase SsuD/methylene tetrahydromethanopterin reductase-like flavin-dependent oxidoreductase (luciferase family)